VVQSRLEHELAVIEQCGYEALFLVMEEIVGFTRGSGIPIASRGSASSSLVAHCLGVTTPDPVRLNLYFERFLNPARATPPDIDNRPVLTAAGRGDRFRVPALRGRANGDGVHGEPLPPALGATRGSQGARPAPRPGERAGGRACRSAGTAA